jgi:curved DNA-binding protein CbpA
MDYYQILGVKYTATHDEIKRAYRRLAVQFHPDKNKEPSAENIFKEINEAYDVLGDPSKKSLYDLKFSSPFTASSGPAEPPRHRDPAYRPNRPRASRSRKQDRLTELMAEYMPFLIRITYGCLAFSAVLLFDFILPAKIEDEKIVETQFRRFYGHRRGATYGVVITSGDHRIDINAEFSNHFVKGRDIVVQSSPLFDIPTRIESEGFAVRLRKSIYGNFIFAPVGLLFFSGLAIYFRKNVRHGFNFGITSILFLILTVAFLNL